MTPMRETISCFKHFWNPTGRVPELLVLLQGFKWGPKADFIETYCGWKKSYTTLDGWTPPKKRPTPSINWCGISPMHSMFEDIKYLDPLHQWFKNWFIVIDDGCNGLETLYSYAQLETMATMSDGGGRLRPKQAMALGCHRCFEFGTKFCAHF